MNYVKFCHRLTASNVNCPISADEFSLLQRFMHKKLLIAVATNARYITQLNLSMKKLTLADVAALFSLMTINSYIRDLNLASNEFAALDVISLAKAITLTSLKGLNLSWNYKVSTIFSADVITRMTALTNLDLSHCDLYTLFPTQLHLALLSHPTLTQLYFPPPEPFNNRMCLALANNTTLRQLYCPSFSNRHTVLTNSFAGMPLEGLCTSGIGLVNSANTGRIITQLLLTPNRIVDFPQLIKLSTLRELAIANVSNLSPLAIKRLTNELNLQTLDVSFILLTLDNFVDFAASNLITLKADATIDNNDTDYVENCSKAARLLAQSTSLLSLSFMINGLMPVEARILTQSTRLTHLSLSTIRWQKNADADETLSTCRVASLVVNMSILDFDDIYAPLARNCYVRQIDISCSHDKVATVYHHLKHNRTMTYVDNLLKLNLELDALLYQNRYYRFWIYETLIAFTPFVVAHSIPPIVLRRIFDFVFVERDEIAGKTAVQINYFTASLCRFFARRKAVVIPESAVGTCPGSIHATQRNNK